MPFAVVACSPPSRGRSDTRQSRAPAAASGTTRIPGQRLPRGSRHRHSQLLRLRLAGMAGPTRL